MASLLFYIRRLAAFAGAKLYINMACMMVVSLFEGVGIFLLVPMLAMIGILDAGMGSSLPASFLYEGLQRFPAKLQLPAILTVYLLLIAGLGLLQRSQTVLNMRIQQGFVRHLRLATYRLLLQARWDFFLRGRKSDIHHALTSELARVSQGTNMFLQLAVAGMFTLIQLGLAFWLSPGLTASILLVGLLLSVFSRKFVRRARVLGEQTTQLSQTYFFGLNEQLSGIKEMKSNALEERHLQWFAAMCRKMEANFVDFIKLRSATQFYYTLVSAVLIAALVYAAVEILHAHPGQLMLVIVIFARLWPRFTMIQSGLEQLTAMLPAFRSLIELQNQCLAAEEATGRPGSGQAQVLTVRTGIECRHVYYRYHEAGSHALCDIRLSIPANRMTAIVGKSGAGKSTLIDILMGLIRPERGEVVIDGAVLTEEAIPSLRQSVGYVSQDPFLFHGSIRENLALVKPDAVESELWEALAFAAADEFVAKLPLGLDTIVGDRAVRLSGGERQRIVLARAVLRKPSILVLDEATSALDADHEAKIQAALESLRGITTLIVVAHRLTTIRQADQVIVLEQGKVAQQGEFRQLFRQAEGAFGKLLGQSL